MIAVAVAICVVAVAGGILVAGAQQSTRDDEAAGAPPSDKLYAALGALRAHVTAEDQLPEDVRAALQHAYGDTPIGQGMDYSGARRAYADKGQIVYVVPSGDYVCPMIRNSFGVHGGCITVDSIVSPEHLSYSVQSTEDGQSVVGVVPDGISSVTANFSDGSQKSMEIDDNVFVLDAARASLDSLNWSDAQGTRHSDSSPRDAHAAAEGAPAP